MSEEANFMIDDLEKALGVTLEELSWRMSTDFVEKLIQFMDEITDEVFMNGRDDGYEEGFTYGYEQGVADTKEKENE